MLFGPGEQVAAEGTPEELLRESLALATRRTDLGDTRTTAALRLGATCRMAGLKSEAQSALEECARLVAKDGNPDNRDETKVELAREFLLLGDVERAYVLAGEVKEREYDLLACFVIAREAAATGNAPGVARAVEKALEIANRQGRKIDSRMGSSLLCMLGRAAGAIECLDLALACEGKIPDPVWKSALVGDRAERSARAGNADEALKIAAEATDPHMAVLALARVAMVSPPAARTRVVEVLVSAAAKIKEAEKRDFALRAAAGKLIAAGDSVAASQVAQAITDSAAKILTLCPLVDSSSFAELTSLLASCSEEERPALAEVLVEACGKRKLTAEALRAAEQVPPGWPRIRALFGAARFSADDRAGPLVAAAVNQLSEVSDAGWRCVARCQIALAAHRSGDAATTATQLTAACKEALMLGLRDDLRAVLPQVVETALDCGRKDLAAETLTRALDARPETALRDVLVPFLVEAGRPESALQKVAAMPLENDYARRFLAYRLAKAGRLADALAYAKTLSSRAQPETLCDLARAQLPDAASKPNGGRRVALSLHGGWFYWPNRLERVGIAWDVMPYCTPYEEGAAGLAARYTMLGYPGAGDHLIQCSPVGLEQVRSYLRDGGGLFGICAGQLFATGHPNGHRFVPADFYYLRGNGPHQVQMTRHHPANSALPPRIIINRQNGDFLIPRPGCDVIGWYDDQNICAAVVAAQYGLGRVVVSSPHPEGDNSYSPTDRLCIEVTRWILDGQP